MAITILQQPSGHTPGYNEQFFGFSSTNYAQPNFRYIVDIYDYTGPTQIVPRIKIIPRTGGYGYIDVGRIIENYLSSDLVTYVAGSEGFQLNTNSYYAYALSIGEEYGSTPVAYPGLASTGYTFATNSLYDYNDWINQTYETDYLITGTSSKFLTNGIGRTSTTPQKIRSNEKAWLYFIVSTTNNAKKLYIEVTDDVGNITQTILTNPYAAMTVNDRHFQRMPVGWNLNDTSGTPSIIKANTVSYRVYLTNNSNTRTSEYYYFIIDDKCTLHDTYRLHFLNKLGGFDSFSFYRNSIKTIDIKRTSYKKPDGNFSAGIWSLNAKDRSDIVFDTNLKDRVTLNSDWISQSEANWLQELVTSPEVYSEESIDNATKNELIPINIVDSIYKIQTRNNSGLYNLTLNIEYSHNRFRQRY